MQQSTSVLRRFEHVEINLCVLRDSRNETIPWHFLSEKCLPGRVQWWGSRIQVSVPFGDMLGSDPLISLLLKRKGEHWHWHSGGDQFCRKVWGAQFDGRGQRHNANEFWRNGRVSAGGTLFIYMHYAIRVVHTSQAREREKINATVYKNHSCIDAQSLHVKKSQLSVA